MARLALTDLETFAEGLDHPEGICVTPAGTIHVGGEAGQVYRIDPDGTPVEIARTDGFILGLACDAAGALYACDIGHRCVWRIDPTTGRHERYTDADGRMRVPNWACFDEDGWLYVSDSGSWKAADGLIWAVAPGGAAAVFSSESVDFPNGMAVTPDGSELWVLESTPGRLVAIPIQDGHTAGARRVVTELPGAVPDGIAFCTDGSVIVSCYRPDVVYRWDASEGLEVIAEDPEGTVLAAPTNVAFTGADLDVMVVPNIGRWHLTRFTVPGLRGVPLRYPEVVPGR